MEFSVQKVLLFWYRHIGFLEYIYRPEKQPEDLDWILKLHCTVFGLKIECGRATDNLR